LTLTGYDMSHPVHVRGARTNPLTTKITKGRITSCTNVFCEFLKMDLGTTTPHGDIGTGVEFVSSQNCGFSYGVVLGNSVEDLDVYETYNPVTDKWDVKAFPGIWVQNTCDAITLVDNLVMLWKPGIYIQADHCIITGTVFDHQKA